MNGNTGDITEVREFVRTMILYFLKYKTQSFVNINHYTLILLIFYFFTCVSNVYMLIFGLIFKQ